MRLLPFTIFCIAASGCLPYPQPVEWQSGDAGDRDLASDAQDTQLDGSSAEDTGVAQDAMRRDGGGSPDAADAADAVDAADAGPMVRMWASVTVGDDHACARTTENEAYCWGENQFGQLGRGQPSSRRWTPEGVAAHSFVALAAGRFFTCGVTPEDQTVCWGFRADGQTDGVDRGANCSGAECFIATPTPIPDVTSTLPIVAGREHACAKSTDFGYVTCWGQNDSQEVSMGPERVALTRIKLPAPKEFTALAASRDATVAIDDQQKIWFWGDGSIVAGCTMSPCPPSESGFATGWSKVSAGTEHACVIALSGRIACWGRNTAFGTVTVNGKAGGSEVVVDEPDSTSSPLNAANANWHEVAAGHDHTCAITADGGVLCWGNNSNGELGVDGATYSELPVGPDMPTGFRTIAVGRAVSCGVTSAGELYCWGDNSRGMLARDPAATTSSTTPLKIDLPAQ